MEKQPTFPSTLLGQQFDEDLSRHDVIVIGELHGTKEIPKIVADLSDELGPQVLFALELKADSAGITCPPTHFSPSWERRRAHGKSSEAMLDMLCRLRNNAERFGNEVLLIDTRSAQQPAFYESAAQRISEKLQTGRHRKVIVLTGNFHSRKGSDNLAGALEQFGVKTLTSTMSSPSGTAWNCSFNDGENVCGASKTQLGFCKGASADELGWTSEVPASSRWERCLTLPTFTASPPADKRETKAP